MRVSLFVSAGVIALPIWGGAAPVVAQNSMTSLRQGSVVRVQSTARAVSSFSPAAMPRRGVDELVRLRSLEALSIRGTTDSSVHRQPKKTQIVIGVLAGSVLGYAVGAKFERDAAKCRGPSCEGGPSFIVGPPRWILAFVGAIAGGLLGRVVP